MKIIAILIIAVWASTMTGCAKKSGLTYLQIENDQSEIAAKAQPVYIDPRVEVTSNEYQISYLNRGANILQKVRIKGPIMIVPASTQPVVR